MVQSLNVKAYSLISVLVRVQFFFLAMLTVLLYDHLLTLPEEVSSIMRDKSSSKSRVHECKMRVPTTGRNCMEEKEDLR